MQYSIFVYVLKVKKLAMADDQDQQLFKKLQSEVTCPLCLDIFTDPKKLPCDHVYCRACLQGLASRSRNGSISCPECRSNTALPRNGANEFSTPHQVNRLIEMYWANLKTAATGCINHKSQPLELYCETCEKVVCSHCVILLCAKQNHKHGFLKDMVEKYKTDLKAQLQPVRKLHEDMSSALVRMVASKRKLQSAKEGKIQQIRERFDALINILIQEKNYFTDCTEKEFTEQQKLFDIKESEIAEGISKLESVIQSADTASNNLSNTEFLAGVAERRICIGKTMETYQALPLYPTLLPEKDSELCNIDDFQAFCYSKNFQFMKSDTSKFHFERSLNLTCLAARETSHITFYMDIQSVKTGIFGKPNLTAQLHSSHDSTSQSINIKKVSNDDRYSMSITPQKQGKHELILKCNNIDVYGSPLPILCTIHPSQLKKLLSKHVSSVCGIKLHKSKLYASKAFEAIAILNSSTLSMQKSIIFPGVGEFHINDPHIYVSDITHHKLHKTDMNGSIIKSIGMRGSGPGQFNFPNGIRLSKNDELYVCDSDNHRIQVFDTDLNLLRILGRKGSTNGYFNWPADLDFDDCGNIYVIEQENRRIQVLTPHGLHIRNIGSGGDLARPVSAAIHRNFIYITDMNNHHVSVYKTTGDFVCTFGRNTLSSPECLAINEDGFIYVSDSRSTIVKF